MPSPSKQAAKGGLPGPEDPLFIYLCFILEIIIKRGAGTPECGGLGPGDAALFYETEDSRSNPSAQDG